ncbi:MAG: GGDEF domain-containing protein [Burkholderiaceae bacterium]|nr:MAG: GGDEF domain-containing protein [Burkholderiaceae bacterium]
MSDIELFRNLDIEQLEFIKNSLAQCPVYKAHAGEIVLDSHNGGGSLYIILRGNLALTSNTARRQLESSTVQYFAGECVGEISVLDDEGHLSTIAAVAESETLAIDSVTMWKLIDEANGVARNLLQLLSFRIRAANAQLRNRQKVGEFYRQLSMVDGLTGLNNRSWLNTQLPGLIESARATGSELSVIMLDLDHFKQFNDRFGHVLGDEALQAAAKVISAGLRPSDFAARYGGEEMIVILPNTAKESALIVAERLCERIRNTKVFQNDAISLPHITASLGLAALNEGQDGLAVIASADAALYRAKERGRNQVAM